MEAIFLILGLITGSFLNLCIYRLPRKESILYRPSHCPLCGKKLKYRDLIPLASYLLLRGRCRTCSSTINLRYPLVEIITGLVFWLTFLYRGLDIILLKNLFIFSLLIIILFIDLEYHIIPNRLVGLFFLWAFLWQILLPEITWLDAFGGAFLGGGFLLLVAIISKGGMGGGDIKLMGAAGLYLGTSLTALALFTGFIGGSLLGIILILLKIKSRKDSIPFGPFLSLGIIIAYLWGAEMVKIYLSFAFPP